jgi:hypothetical protein
MEPTSLIHNPAGLHDENSENFGFLSIYAMARNTNATNPRLRAARLNRRRSVTI